MEHPRIIISGGGTGGHIFPALSIAESVKEIEAGAEFLFVGAQGRMEMERIPAAGYTIKGLPVSGLQRRLSLENLSLPCKIVKSVRMASRIIDEFKPDVAVGVGGYASGPLLWAATRKGIPTLIQEQNSYAGLTNRILGRRADVICTAYDNMERFFPQEKIILTGNPIRKSIYSPTEEARSEGLEFYNLDPGRKTILVVGGSLGSATLNRTVKMWVDRQPSNPSPYQVIWQCGTSYSGAIEPSKTTAGAPNVRLTKFIKRMDLAFAAADVIISRAGAGTISELCVVGKPVIFVPSPNVTEDHQTHNAEALVNKGAALMVSDADAPAKAMEMAENLLADEETCARMSHNILQLQRSDAGARIAAEVLALARRNR